MLSYCRNIAFQMYLWDTKFRRLITSYRQFDVDLRQNVVFALKDDVTSYGLRVITKETIRLNTRNAEHATVPLQSSMLFTLQFSIPARPGMVVVSQPDSTLLGTGHHFAVGGQHPGRRVVGSFQGLPLPPGQLLF